MSSGSSNWSFSAQTLPCLSFSARGLLLHDSPSFEKWCFSFIQDHRLPLDKQQFREIYLKSLRSIMDAYRSSEPPVEEADYLLQKIFEKISPSLVDRARDHHRASLRLAIPQTTYDVLESLRERGYRLAVISNEVDELREVLRIHRLLDFFDFVLTRGDLPSPKPSSLAFQVLLEEFGCRPHQVIHIGDRYVFDVLGARSVQIRSILYDPEGLEAVAYGSAEEVAESKVVSLDQKRAAKFSEDTLVIRKFEELQKVFC